MEYINIKHNKDNTTNIHTNVFYDILRMLPSKIKGVKISEPEIVIVRNNKNIDISFNYTISKNLDIFETSNSIKKWITDIVLNLIDLKINNILMNYKGRH